MRLVITKLDRGLGDKRIQRGDRYTPLLLCLSKPQAVETGLRDDIIYYFAALLRQSAFLLQLRSIVYVANNAIIGAFIKRERQSATSTRLQHECTLLENNMIFPHC